MRPITYLPHDVATGPRIGGTAPSELRALYRDTVTQYFGTFPVLSSNQQEFSIFHRIDPFGDDPVRNAIDNNNQILNAPELIWCIVHPVSRRGEISENAFEARGLLIGEETEDLISNENEADPQRIPYTQSKLGGRCFVERHQIRKVVQELEFNKFQHLLQIGMHGRDIIEGFPWDPGFLNVWALDPLVAASYRFCLQQ